MNPLFKYHSRDSKGVTRDGTVEALDEADAVNKLQEQGLIVISIEMTGIGKPEIVEEEQHGITKKCPYCAEEIKDAAILCRFCGKQLGVKSQDIKWYFKTHRIIIAFLCVGPLALPLVWFNPRFSRRIKVIVTIIVIILSWFLVTLILNSLASLKQYYGLILG